MLDKVEKYFDTCAFVIVPTSEGENGGLKVVVLADSILTQYVDVSRKYTFKDLNHTSLQFLTTQRPGKRYLYFKTIMALYIRKRYAATGWEHDLERIGTGNVWATPGKYLRQSTLLALALEYGDTEQDQPATPPSGGISVALTPLSGIAAELGGALDQDYDREVALTLRGRFEHHVEQDDWSEELEELHGID